MNSIPYNARYLKLSGKVRQWNRRVQNEVRINSFVTSRSICVDTGQAFCKCFRANSLINKIRRNTILDYKRKEFCGADFIGRGIIDFPNPTKANIQFIEEDTTIWNYIFNASNFIPQKIFDLSPIIKARKTKKFPFLVWIQRWVNALGNQIDDIAQKTCFHMRDGRDYLLRRLLIFIGSFQGITAGKLGYV